jgi:hypothetical protein
MDALTDTPIEDCEPDVDSSDGLPACLPPRLRYGSRSTILGGAGLSDPDMFASSLPFYYVHPHPRYPWILDQWRAMAYQPAYSKGGEITEEGK